MRFNLHICLLDLILNWDLGPQPHDTVSCRSAGQTSSLLFLFLTPYSLDQLTSKLGFTTPPRARLPGPCGRVSGRCDRVCYYVPVRERA